MGACPAGITGTRIALGATSCAGRLIALCLTGAALSSAGLAGATLSSAGLASATLGRAGLAGVAGISPTPNAGITGARFTQRSAGIETRRTATAFTTPAGEARIPITGPAAPALGCTGSAVFSTDTFQFRSDARFATQANVQIEFITGLVSARTSPGGNDLGSLSDEHARAAKASEW